MSIEELIEWLRHNLACALDASKVEVTALWNIHLGLIDSCIANPDTTPARFKEVANSCDEFNTAVSAEHKRYVEKIDEILAELAQRLQAHIDTLGTGGKATDNPRVLRLRMMKKKHIEMMYRNTTARVVLHKKATAVDDFAGAVRDIRQYRENPQELLSILEKEKLVDEVHPPVDPFIVDGLCVGPATRSGRPLLIRTVCRHCSTVFHGKSAREIVKKRPYLGALLLRQCPVKPDKLCVDSLELARVTHTAPSDEFVVSLRDAYKEQYKSQRAERNKRFYVNQRRMLED